MVVFRCGSKDVVTSMKPTIPDPNHDHRQCVDQAIAVANRICRQNKTRFTKLRRRVLELIWTSHEPVGAYGVLALMNAETEGNVAPMTVYRAIDFLIENRLVHRIASRNAYVGCSHPDSPHAGQLIICNDCGRVGEILEDTITKAVAAGAERVGFDGVSSVIEIQGRCHDCRELSDIHGNAGA